MKKEHPFSYKGPSERHEARSQNKLEKMGQEHSAGKRGGGQGDNNNGGKNSDSLDKLERELAAEQAKNAPPVEITTMDVRSTWRKKCFGFSAPKFDFALADAQIVALFHRIFLKSSEKS